MAYYNYINTLDSQSSGRGRGRPNYFKVGGLFEKFVLSRFHGRYTADTDR